MNCAFDDKSMKLCAQLEYTFKNISVYRDSANLTHNKNSSMISKMTTNDSVNLWYHFLEETHGTKCMACVVYLQLVFA